MSVSQFRTKERVLRFFIDLRSTDLKKLDTLLYLLGWLFSLGMLLFVGVSGFAGFLFFVLYLYFWFKLVSLIDKSLRPPSELLIFVLYLSALAEMALLQFVYRSTASPAVPLQAVQFTILASQFLLFSLILVRNSGGKRRVLLLYLLLVFVAMVAFQSPRPFYGFVFQLVLFIFLLRKTSWLETLSKMECWITLVFAIFLFRYLLQFDLFRSVQAVQFEQPIFWFLLPRFTHSVVKLYLLAVLLKIPVVLVYNFARLSRKLRISSLFQSTFPQIIQLVLLSITFYCFLAGWQAEKVRQALAGQTERAAGGASVAPTVAVKIPLERGQSVQFSDYQSVRAPKALPEQGILSLLKTGNGLNDTYSHFFFSKSSNEASEQVLNLVKLDANFLQTITENASVLAGSALMAYPYDPPNWESFILQASLFDQRDAVRIFPFGLPPEGGSETLSAPFYKNLGTESAVIERLNSRMADEHRYSVGRIIVPVFNADGDRRRFFAFDILLLPDLSFFTLTLSSYLVLLGVVYALVNFVVIQRMVKFGSEINKMIVQKFNQLTTGIRQVASGNLDYKIRFEGEDEFVELAEGFNQMGDKLKESIAEAREREALQQELAIARKVQLGMLPRTLPAIPGFQLAASLKTANAVGGDFYDILELEDGRFLFAIGDVSGKSTSAAFYMAQCISLFRYSRQFTSEPHDIASRLNRYFSDPDVDRQIFVTAIFGVLDPKSRVLRMVRAGHTPPLHIPGANSDQIRELEFKGIGIGLDRSGQSFDNSLQDGKMNLVAGDTVVFYTDGVVEASKTKDDPQTQERVHFFGEERFLNLMSEVRGNGSQQILDRVLRELEDFYRGEAPVDDYTLLVIQKS